VVKALVPDQDLEKRLMIPLEQVAIASLVHLNLKPWLTRKGNTIYICCLHYSNCQKRVLPCWKKNKQQLSKGSKNIAKIHHVKDAKSQR